MLGGACHTGEKAHRLQPAGPGCGLAHLCSPAWPRAHLATLEDSACPLVGLVQLMPVVSWLLLGRVFIPDTGRLRFGDRLHIIHEDERLEYGPAGRASRGTSGLESKHCLGTACEPAACGAESHVGAGLSPSCSASSLALHQCTREGTTQPKCLGPCAHVGGLEECTGSCLWPGAALAVVVI